MLHNLSSGVDCRVTCTWEVEMFLSMSCTPAMRCGLVGRQALVRYWRTLAQACRNFSKFCIWISPSLSTRTLPLGKWAIIATDMMYMNSHGTRVAQYYSFWSWVPDILLKSILIISGSLFSCPLNLECSISIVLDPNVLMYAFQPACANWNLSPRTTPNSLLYFEQNLRRINLPPRCLCLFF